MTNPGITSPLEIDTWPIRTVRCAGALIIISSLINVANLKLVTHVPAFPALAYTLFDLAVGCALVTFTFTIIFREHWQSITWIGSVLIIASDGITGAMHGEIIMFLITVMLMMMGSGAILPWSVRWQGSFNIFCVLAWSAMRLRSGGHDAEQAAEWVGVLCAAAIAQAITAMRERYIRERERSEGKIRESEEKLRKVFEVSSDVITISSMDGRYIDVNPAFETTGYSRAEAIGNSEPRFSVWPSPADRKRFQDEIMASGQVKNLELGFRARDGTIIPCLVSAAVTVADDSADNRMLITAFLKKMPYCIDEVENGALAIEHFKARKYDLVLMDIQMPVMDGHAATRAIRDWERDNHRVPTPIIALSAAALSESFIDSRAAGCDEHVTKPIRKAALLEVIDRVTA